ncbi:hypothetical protein GWI33_017269 [Rhynchophorus ferrugineus]|uniref:Uncharacterized protein n=1 Tax=Rhynchophorus ferrugineus TaxID=354439 RepID=A0A834I9J1_RHYFE|nr:hypothetical protein GWI33_017269 [Rhynchophorus ferrugineus]
MDRGAATARPPPKFLARFLSASTATRPPHPTPAARVPGLIRYKIPDLSFFICGPVFGFLFCTSTIGYDDVAGRQFHPSDRRNIARKPGRSVFTHKECPGIYASHLRSEIWSQIIYI